MQRFLPRGLHQLHRRSYRRQVGESSVVVAFASSPLTPPPLRPLPQTYQDCVLNSNSSVGLITCDEDYGCPAFFQDGADQGTDQTSGWVCFFLSLFFLVLCLIFLIKVLSR